jgi:hypothetical protein
MLGKMKAAGKPNETMHDHQMREEKSVEKGSKQTKPNQMDD